MNKTIERAKEMYNEYNFGKFSYGDKRKKYAVLLPYFLQRINENHTLYDIGCGAGFWLNMYVESGVKKENITATDLSPNNIEHIKKQGFNAYCGNVLELNFKDNVSDFTICDGVIHHTSDPFKAFSELVRITKPGGHIYLVVYNIWNPYFYLIHKATFPIRYIYWNYNRKIADITYGFSKILFQPIAYLILGKFLDEKTGKTMFMDQVITPRAHLFSKKTILSYAKRCNCKIEVFRYIEYFLELSCIIKVVK